MLVIKCLTRVSFIYSTSYL